MSGAWLIVPLVGVLAGAGPGGMPAPIVPDRQGVLALPASLARLQGESPTLDAPRGVLRGWRGGDGRASWDVAIPREGSYQVVVEYALGGKGPGGRVRVRVGGEARQAFAAPTGSAFLPQPLVDPITLKPGRARVTLDAPGWPPDSALEVRAVRLIPANP